MEINNDYPLKDQHKKLLSNQVTSSIKGGKYDIDSIATIGLLLGMVDKLGESLITPNVLPCKTFDNIVECLMIGILIKGMLVTP